MIVISNNCMACGQCVEYCITGAIDIKSDTGGYAQAVINQELCVQCGVCLTVDCPADAIKEVEA